MTPRRATLIGSVFERLSVIANGRNAKYYVCLCTCGATKEVRADHLVCGKIRSCGCLRSEKSSERTGALHKANMVHGHSKSSEHNTWCNMKSRCDNKNHHNYADYGGRGITVCKRWQASFEGFYADMGPRPDGFTLERKDNNKGYSPSNCVWASRADQQNNRRVNRRVVYNGSSVTISELSKLIGVHRNTLTLRVDSGMAIERITSTQKLVGFFSKLTKEDAANIRSSKETGRALAKLYGVSEGNISAIRTGRSWKT